MIGSPRKFIFLNPKGNSPSFSHLQMIERCLFSDISGLVRQRSSISTSLKQDSLQKVTFYILDDVQYKYRRGITVSSDDAEVLA